MTARLERRIALSDSAFLDFTCKAVIFKTCSVEFHWPGLVEDRPVVFNITDLDHIAVRLSRFNQPVPSSLVSFSSKVELDVVMNGLTLIQNFDESRHDWDFALRVYQAGKVDQMFQLERTEFVKLCAFIDDCLLVNSWLS